MRLRLRIKVPAYKPFPIWIFLWMKPPSSNTLGKWNGYVRIEDSLMEVEAEFYDGFGKAIMELRRQGYLVEIAVPAGTMEGRSGKVKFSL